MDYGTALRRRFPHAHPVLLPVVHVFSASQAVRNASLALEDARADGVLLIVHRTRSMAVPPLQLLKDAFTAVRAALPAAWIGVNALSLAQAPMQLFAWVQRELGSTCDGVWVDEAYAQRPAVCARLDEARALSGFGGLYLGGMAFKHQEVLAADQDAEEPSATTRTLLRDTARRLSAHCDVVVTSGARTGELPSLAKVEACHEGACPLGVSGVGDHYALFASCCDVVIAATALTRECPVHAVRDECAASFGEFDADILRAWVKRCRVAARPHGCVQ